MKNNSKTKILFFFEVPLKPLNPTNKKQIYATVAKYIYHNKLLAGYNEMSPRYSRENCLLIYACVCVISIG